MNSYYFGNEQGTKKLEFENFKTNDVAKKETLISFKYFMFLVQKNYILHIEYYLCVRNRPLFELNNSTFFQRGLSTAQIITIINVCFMVQFREQKPK